MSKQFVFTIGLPFSGKSELAKQYAVQGFTVIERDALLQEILKSDEFVGAVTAANEQEKPANPAAEFAIKNRIAIEILNRRLHEVVMNAESGRVFYDGTNLQRKVREGLAAFGKEGFDVTGIVLDVPAEEIVRRAAEVHSTGARAGQFNEGALQNLIRMSEMFELPEPSEGFNIEIRTWQPEGDEPAQEQKQELHRGVSKK